MNDLDVPIFRKMYDLYKLFNGFRRLVPKQERYTLFERTEMFILDCLEYILTASQSSKTNKLIALEQASVKLNLARVFIRLLKDVKALDNKKYINLQEPVDEIGRMLGGWIKSAKQ